MPSLLRRSALVVLLLASLLATLFAAGCGPQPTPETIVEEKEVVVTQEVEVEVEVVVTATPEPVGEKELRIGNAEPTMGLDPAQAGTSTSLRVLEMLHDSLWEWDENFEPKPWMAESWDIADDYTEYTFHLRSDLKFSDGSPITADDVKFSYERLAESELWQARLSVLESVEAPDAQTVVLKLSRPAPEFMILPGVNVNFFVVSKAAVEAGADFNEPGTPVAGPFMLEEWVPKSHLVLVRNPHWWGIEAMGYPKFDRIMWRFNEDATAGVAAVESGAVDLFNPFPAKDAPRMAFVQAATLYKATAVTFRGFGMDKTQPPFSDQLVRQAIGLASKPTDANDVCWFGTGDLLWGGYVYGWQNEWYSDVKPWDKPRDEKLAEANALLDEAGWRDEDSDGVREAHGVEGVADGTPFEVSVPFEANWPQAECHTLLLRDWMRDIGVKVNPDRYDPGSFWSDVIDSKFQMWHAGIGGHLWSPQMLQIVFHSDGAYNKYFMHYSDPELDGMIDEMLAETDVDKMKAMVHDIEVFLADQQYILATGSQNQLHLLNSDIDGYYLNPNDSNRALIVSDIPGR